MGEVVGVGVRWGGVGECGEVGSVRWVGEMVGGEVCGGVRCVGGEVCGGGEVGRWGVVKCGGVG